MPATPAAPAPPEVTALKAEVHGAAVATTHQALEARGLASMVNAAAVGSLVMGAIDIAVHVAGTPIESMMLQHRDDLHKFVSDTVLQWVADIATKLQTRAAVNPGEGETAGYQAP